MGNEQVATLEEISKKSSRDFTDADLSAIKKAADEEYEGKTKKKEEKPKEEKPKEEAAPKEETQPKPEDKAKEEKEKEEARQKQIKEDERILAAKDEELSEEDKTRKTELLKLQEENRQKAEKEAQEKEKARQEEIKSYAKEKEISEEKAKEIYEHADKIIEKYSDNRKLAIAYYHLQALEGNAQNELKTLKNQLSQPKIELTIENIVKQIEAGKLQQKGKSITREEAIEAYRRENADIAEPLEDDAVLKLMAKDIKDKLENSREKTVANMAIQAKDKRMELLNSLAEADKKFIPDIKTLIDKMPDTHILSDNFSMNDIVRWAKGGVDLKKLEDDSYKKGYEKGKEEGKILGVKQPPAPKSDNKSKPKTRTLTEAEKRRALEMFDGIKAKDEDKFKWFIEIEEDRKKKKE